MKIAVLAHLKYPIAQPFSGGLEMHTHLLTRLLRRAGHEVSLFCARGSDPALAPIEVCEPTGEARGDAVLHAAIDAAESQAYAEIVERVAAGGFDLVHNNCLHEAPLRRSREIAAPMLTVLHTPPFDSLTAGVDAARPDMTFVAVSPTLALEWREHLPDTGVIGNGIDLAAFAFRPVADAEPYALWSGRIVPEKAPHLAIDAARAAGIPLRMAGPRNDLAYWDAEIAPRLGPGVTDLGHLAQTELSAQLGGARVALVTPRWEEPFGLVVAEALACGTPVAGFRRGALPDILDASSGRLASADDVAGLADAVRSALALDRRACRDRAEALFDAATMTGRYEDLYRALLANRAEPAAPDDVAA